MSPDAGLDGDDSGFAGDASMDSVAMKFGESPQNEERVEEMEDERLQILRMVGEHKVSAEEAAQLLSALDASPKPADLPAASQPRWLRIRVTDTATGRAKVNVNIPVGIITVAGRLGARLGLAKYTEPEGLNLDELIEAIRSGAQGKLVDVNDDDGGEHVEVFVE